MENNNSGKGLVILLSIIGAIVLIIGIVCFVSKMICVKYCCCDDCDDECECDCGCGNVPSNDGEFIEYKKKD